MYTLACGEPERRGRQDDDGGQRRHVAAELGVRVLLVDLDPQANATALTDAQPRVYEDGAFGKAQQLTVSDALHAAQERESAAVQPGTLYQVTVAAGEHWSARLHVAGQSEPGGSQRGRLRWGRPATGGSARLPQPAVRPGGGELRPDAGGLFVAAMFAADAVLLVSGPAAHALQGLPRTIALAASVAAQRSHDVRPVLFGVLPTSVGRETRQTELLERRL